MSPLPSYLESRASEDIYVQKDDLLPARKRTFWKKKDEKNWLRITAQIDSNVTTDDNVEWSPAFLQEFELVQRTMWQKIRKTEIEGAILGPNNEDYKATSGRREVTLAWSKEETSPLKTAIEKHIHEARSKLISLGSSLGVIDGAPPIVLSLDMNEQYGPSENVFIPAHETREKVQKGMDFILGQVREFSKEGEQPSTNLLRNLKDFRKTHARWAEIKGRNIRSLEDGRKNSAWMAVVSNDSEILQEQVHAALVRREPEGIMLMRILPIDFTKEWAGLIGIHELEHLENALTGKEPENPTKEQYVDGEIRAFSVEIAGADILSKGSFLRGIDAVIDGYNLSSIEDVIAANNSPTILALAKNLDRYITSSPPLSRSEAGMRLAFYLVAVGFRIAERLGKDDEAKTRELKKKLIEQFYAKQLGEIDNKKESVLRKEPTPSPNEPGSLDEALEMLTTALKTRDCSLKTVPEIQYQEVINTTSREFLAFGSSLESAINSLPQETRQQKALVSMLRIPFQLEYRNTQNPLRNGLVAKRISLEMGMEDPTFLLQAQADPFYVSYDVLPIDDSKFLAGFAGTRRTMVLPDDMKTAGIVGQLAQFHEYIHVYQHAERRKQMGLVPYLKFCSQSDNAIPLIDEVQAYGYEIEIVNLKMNDRLRKAGMAGIQIPPREIMEELDISLEYETAITFISLLASLYYKNGGVGNDPTYPEEYVHLLMRSMKHDGQTPYQFDEQGRPQKI